MKYITLFVILFICQVSNGQISKSKLKLIQKSLNELNVNLKNSEIKLDTLLANKDGIILSIIDSTSLKEMNFQDAPLVFFAEDTVKLWYIGRFGKYAHLPALFEIRRFPNQEKLIIMDYGETGQGYFEQSLTLFKKTKNGISQLCPTILETGLANSGLCPDLEKCYEYESKVINVEEDKITFNKRGTYLDHKDDVVKPINEFFYLRLQNGKWELIRH